MKEFLSQKGINYRNRDVTIDPTASQELMSRIGRSVVPVTIIDGKTIVGFDRPRLEQLLADYKSGPSLGASVIDTKKVEAVKQKTGAYIGKLKPGSLAENLGLAAGDIIIDVNNQKITGVSDLENVMSRLQKGNPIIVSFERNNNLTTVRGTV